MADSGGYLGLSLNVYLKKWKSHDKVGTVDCHKDAECINTIGRFECICKDGYKGPGQNCSDVDECNLGQSLKQWFSLEVYSRKIYINSPLAHNCDVNSNCINTHGGHNCECRTGFNGTGLICLGIGSITNLTLGDRLRDHFWHPS